MANVATSVRIASNANSVLTDLANRFGKSKAQVIETAHKEREERIFWEEVRCGFARIAADPEEAARQKAEIETWDRVSSVDFKNETW